VALLVIKRECVDFVGSLRGEEGGGCGIQASAQEYDGARDAAHLGWWAER